MELIENTKRKLSFSGSRTWFFRCLSVFIIVLFIFFLTSNMWLKVSTSVDVTPIGTQLNLDSETTITLKSWKYNKDQGFMLVDIGTNCNYVDIDYSYSVRAVDNLDRTVDISVVYSNLDFMFLNLSNIPSCNSLDIVVTLITKGSLLTETSGETSESSQTFSAKFSLVLDEIEVDNTVALDFTENELILQDWGFDIDVLNIQIDDLNNNIESNNTVIANANDRIAELEESKSYKTSDEVEQINGQIEKLENNITDANESITETEQEIALLQEKISAVEKKITAFINQNTEDRD